MFFLKANSSDEENVAPRASLRDELRRVQRQMDAFEREFAEASEEARTGTDDMIEKFKEIMEPETDYDSDALMFSETESESSDSDSSIFSDSSDSSSQEEGDEAEREECKGEEQKTMVLKVRLALIRRNFLFKCNIWLLNFYDFILSSF